MRRVKFICVKKTVLMKLSFLDSVSVKCSQDISFGMLKKGTSLRDLVLPQAD